MFIEGMQAFPVAQMPKIGSVPYASHLMGELEKLRRYLNSLALISRDSPLEMRPWQQTNYRHWTNILPKICQNASTHRGS